MTSKGPLPLLIMGLSSLKGAPAGNRVRNGAPDTLKELSFLQEASYVYQENSIRRLHMGRQKVLDGAPFKGGGRGGAGGAAVPTSENVGEQIYLFAIQKILRSPTRGAVRQVTNVPRKYEI